MGQGDGRERWTASAPAPPRYRERLQACCSPPWRCADAVLPLHLQATLSKRGPGRDELTRAPRLRCQAHRRLAFAKLLHVRLGDDTIWLD